MSAGLVEEWDLAELCDHLGETHVPIQDLLLSVDFVYTRFTEKAVGNPEVCRIKSRIVTSRFKGTGPFRSRQKPGGA